MNKWSCEQALGMRLPASVRILFVGGDDFMEQLSERTKSRHFPGVLPFCHALPRLSPLALPLRLMQEIVRCVY